MLEGIRKGIRSVRQMSLHSECRQKNKPKSDVGKRLDDVCFLEMRVSNARIVGAHSRNGDVAFAFGEAFGADGVRGKEEEDCEGPADC